MTTLDLADMKDMTDMGRATDGIAMEFTTRSLLLVCNSFSECWQFFVGMQSLGDWLWRWLWFGGLLVRQLLYPRGHCFYILCFFLYTHIEVISEVNNLQPLTNYLLVYLWSHWHNLWRRTMMVATECVDRIATMRLRTGEFLSGMPLCLKSKAKQRN